MRDYNETQDFWNAVKPHYQAKRQKLYNKLFKKQRGKCLLCGVHQTDSKRGLYIDHNHETGQARGLLCHHCNSMLGFAKDNVETLKRAIDYLND